ncbi:MAG: hypothetical protein AB7H80_18400 [Candidatus Kapaibacterium sp.]
MNRSTVNEIRFAGEEEIGTSELVLFICKGFSGEICRVALNPSLMLEEAIPMIADQIGYYSPDWEKIGLYNLTRDFEYESGVPFTETRSENGDLVMMADGAACHKEE